MLTGLIIHFFSKFCKNFEQYETWNRILKNVNLTFTKQTFLWVITLWRFVYYNIRFTIIILRFLTFTHYKKLGMQPRRWLINSQSVDRIWRNERNQKSSVKHSGRTEKNFTVCHVEASSELSTLSLCFSQKHLKIFFLDSICTLRNSLWNGLGKWPYGRQDFGRYESNG